MSALGEARIERLQQITLYLCALLGFAACAAHGAGTSAGALFAVSWLLSPWQRARALSARIASWIWSAALIAALAWTVASIWLGADPIEVGVRFLIALLSVKLWSRDGGARDDWQIHALSFLLMAAGSALNEDVAYGAIFAFYVAAATFGIALLHWTSERAEARPLAEPASLNARHFGILGALAALLFASSVALFFAMPRVGLGVFTKKTRAPVAMTGFSTQVELGSHGVIRDNPSVVMRVEFPDGGAMPPGAKAWHWRVMSFDSYDGRSWTRSKAQSGLALPTVRGERDLYTLAPLHSPALAAWIAPRSQLKMRVYLEPLGAEQLPWLWTSSDVALPSTLPDILDPDSASLARDPHYGDLIVRRRNEIGLLYEMRIAPQPDPDALIALATEPPPPPPAPYFEVPSLSPRVEALARRITAEADDPLSKARALREHLASSYAYTTDIPPVIGADPIESFLFENRRGHCEFFASSMVLMLRSQGIAARLVNGFLGGAWNPSGSFMAVRQGDAHAWVEAFIPSIGWVPFDPTPAAGTEPVVENGPVAVVRDLYEAARMAWMRWVIEYDLDAQLGLARDVLRAIAPRSAPAANPAGAPRSSPGGASRGLSLRALLPWLGLAAIVITSWFASRRAARRARAARRFWGVWFLLGVGASSLGAAWLGAYRAWETSALALGALAPGAVWIVSALVKPWIGERRDRARRALALIERAAARSGLDRAPDEGAALFFERLVQRRPELERDACFFAERYLAARFDGAASPELDRALMACAKRIARALRS